MNIILFVFIRQLTLRIVVYVYPAYVYYIIYNCYTTCGLSRLAFTTVPAATPPRSRDLEGQLNTRSVAAVAAASFRRH